MVGPAVEAPGVQTVLHGPKPSVDFKVPGMEVAQEPDRPPVGKSAFDCKHERINGYVQRYAADNGWGFVRSEQFDGELFFHSEELMQEFQNHRIKAGERVEFTVQADEQDRQSAVLVKPIVHRTAFECLGNRYRGYIRRFAERWGFLNSAAFDGDLFVHRDNLLPQPESQLDKEKHEKDIGPGLLVPKQMVEFDVMLDERGRAVAKFITTKVPSPPYDWLGLRVRGHIRSFQDRWGFLNSDRFQGDLFIHRDGLMPQFQSGTLGPGTIVEFDVEMDNHRSRGPRNRLVARNVAVLQMPNGETPGSGYGWREHVPYYSSESSYNSIMDSNSYASSFSNFSGSMWNAQNNSNVLLPNSSSGMQLQAVPEVKEEEWAEWARTLHEKGPMTHIAIKDWEAGDQGQLPAKKGQMITVSHEVPHGWAYGAHLKLPNESPNSKVEEGWIPKAMVKQVTLRQAICDWPGEGSGSTLSVKKGEWVAISREADRGWVYGDRVLSEFNSQLGGGWMPKKILQ